MKENIAIRFVAGYGGAVKISATVTNAIGEKTETVLEEAEAARILAAVLMRGHRTELKPRQVYPRIYAETNE